MRAFSQTDRGMKRDNNEDCAFMDEEKRIYIVADGMGGHNAGEVASRIACEAVKTQIGQRIEAGTFDFETQIEEILKFANDEINKFGNEHSEYSNMGTTIVVAYFDNEMLYVANVGDSRLYLVNEATLHQITKDHSLVAELIKIGSISEAEAYSHPDRNIITSALGVDDTFEIYQTKIPFFEYQYALLCTDGLTNMVSEEELFDVLGQEAFDNAASKMIELANQNGGFDNITVICIKL